MKWLEEDTRRSEDVLTRHRVAEQALLRRLMKPSLSRDTVSTDAGAAGSVVQAAELPSDQSVARGSSTAMHIEPAAGWKNWFNLYFDIVPGLPVNTIDLCASQAQQPLPDAVLCPEPTPPVAPSTTLANDAGSEPSAISGQPHCHDRGHRV